MFSLSGWLGFEWIINRVYVNEGDCKKALVEAEGDMDKAVEVILKKGQAKSAKRAGKVAAEGTVRAEIFNGGKSAMLVEINIETDFSARNEMFAAFSDRVVAASKDADEGAELDKLVHEGKTLKEHADELTAVIGEKITLRRLAKLNVDGSGLCQSYVHMGGKIGVVIAISAEKDAAADHDAAVGFNQHGQGTILGGAAQERGEDRVAVAVPVLGDEDVDVVFGAFHLSFETVIRFVPTATLGMVIAWAVWRTGSIWVGALMHFLNNGAIVVLASAPAMQELFADPDAPPPWWRE